MLDSEDTTTSHSTARLEASQRYRASHGIDVSYAAAGEKTSIGGDSPRMCIQCREIVWESFLPNGWCNDSLTSLGSKRDGGGMAVRLPGGQAIEESGRSRDKHKLGSLRDVIARAEEEACESCSFIVGMLQKHKGSDTLPTEIDGQLLPCTIYKYTIGTVVEDSRAESHHSMATTGWRISRLDISCVTETGKSFVGFSVPGAAVIGPSLSGKRQHKSTATYAGRRRPARCDYSVFRRWLAICDDHHQCSSVSVTWERPFRLIDVQSRCLRSFAKDGSSERYFALSYVWGDCRKDHNLVRANIDRYHEPGGLRSLPKTIEDAICFVRSMGHGYLWVDALCIIQDDPADYAVQIPRMAAVYGGAYATIIAAAGGNAEAGLPGVNVGRSEVLFAELGAFSVVESTAPVNSYHGGPIVQTIWNTRAWTFQEYLLSRRSIIFLADQVCWTCREAEFLEEMDFDSAGVRFRWGNNNGCSEGVTAPSLKEYGYIMSQYTKRHLTNPHDIFDAFMGIMQDIPGEFFWGLPVARFGDYLTWAKPGFGYRDDQEPRLAWRGIDGCPSWSWMAWRCDGQGVSMNYDGSPPESLVGCYRLDATNAKLVLLSEPTASRFFMGNEELGDVPEYTVWSAARSYACTLEDVPEGVALTKNHIVFRTLVVRERSKEYALLGTYGWGGLRLMELGWENGVARRKGLVFWDGSAFPMEPGRVERKIIVLG